MISKVSNIRRSRLIRLGLAALLTTLVLLSISLASSVLPAKTAQTKILSTGQLVDEADDVADASAVEKALADQSKDGVKLYVFFTDSFNGDTSANWCSEVLYSTVRDDSSAALALAVATDEREYTFCNSYGLQVGRQALDDIDKAVLSYLGSNNWDQAAIEFASTAGSFIGKSIFPTEAPKPFEKGVSTESNNSNSGDILAVLVGFILIILFVSGVIFCLRWLIKTNKQIVKRLKKNRTDQAELKERIDQVSAQTMQADNALRSAREDIEFANLEYSAEQTVRFENNVEKAHRLVTKAFEELSKLEDTTDRESRKALVNRIDHHSGQALALLEEQRKLNQQIRESQESAGKRLALANRRLSELRSKLEQAELELKNLAAQYKQTDLSSIENNPTQAANLLENVEETIKQGQQAWDRDDHSGALSFAEISERALSQTDMILNAVLKASKHLKNARATLLDAIYSISSDLGDVKKLAPGQGRFDPLVAEAKAAIEQAKRVTHKRQGDPLAALERLTTAEAALDKELDPLRNRSLSRSRAVTRVKEKLQRVSEQVDRYDQYISSHRGTVSTGARLRISKAKSCLSEAEKIVKHDRFEAMDDALDLLKETDRISQLAYAEARDNTNLVYEHLSGKRSNQSRSERSGVDLGALMLGGILFGGDSQKNSRR